MKDKEFLDAVSKGDIQEAVDAIIGGADINAVTPSRNNAFNLALMKGNKDMFDWLLKVEKAGQKIDINHQNRVGESAMHILVELNNASEYLKSIESVWDSIDLSLVDVNGKNPLIRAIFERRNSVINYLLDNNKKAKTPVDLNYRMPDSEANALILVFQEIADPEDIINKLIEGGVDINAKTSDGENILLTLMSRSLSSKTKEEIEKDRELALKVVDLPGLDLNSKANSGITAFWMACELGMFDLVEKLIDKNVDVNVSHNRDLKGFKESINRSSLSILMSSLKSLAHEGKGVNFLAKIVKHMDRKGVSMNAADESGNTPSSYFLMFGGKPSLLNQIGGDINALICSPPQRVGGKVLRSKTGIISNYLKNKANTEEIFELIDLGAKVCFEDMNDSSITSKPIVESVLLNKEVFNYLAKHKDIDLSIEMVNTLPNGKKVPINIAEIYLEQDHKKNIININSTLESFNSLLESIDENKNENTELTDIEKEEIQNKKEENKSKIKERIVRAEEKKQNLIKEMNLILTVLKDNNFDFNLKTASGDSLLFSSGSLPAAKKLIDNGLSVNVEDVNHTSFASHLIKKGEVEMLVELEDVFLREGVTYNQAFYDLSFTNISQQDAQNIERVINTLPDKFNVDIEDDVGNTPLMVASSLGSEYLIEVLINSGANINKLNNEGECPLLHAAASGNYQAVSKLVFSGADIDVEFNGLTVEECITGKKTEGKYDLLIERSKKILREESKSNVKNKI